MEEKHLHEILEGKLIKSAEQMNDPLCTGKRSYPPNRNYENNNGLFIRDRS